MISPAPLHRIIERLNSSAIEREVSAALFMTHTCAIANGFVAEGDVGGITLPVRWILKHAAETGAHQILLIHTHPSGDPRPSQQDIATTRNFCALLRCRNIRLMDHLILGADRYFSFRAHGML